MQLLQQLLLQRGNPAWNRSFRGKTKCTNTSFLPYAQAETKRHHVSAMFPGDDWDDRECNRTSHRDLPGRFPASVGSAKRQRGRDSPSGAASQAVNTAPDGTNDASAVNNGEGSEDRHSSWIWNHKHVQHASPEALIPIKLPKWLLQAEAHSVDTFTAFTAVYWNES